MERLSDPSALPEFGPLRVAAARESVTATLLRSLASTYATVYDTLFDEHEGYDVSAAANVVRYSPGQVRVLLGTS